MIIDVNEILCWLVERDRLIASLWLSVSSPRGACDRAFTRTRVASLFKIVIRIGKRGNREYLKLVGFGMIIVLKLFEDSISSRLVDGDISFANSFVDTSDRAIAFWFSRVLWIGVENQRVDADYTIKTIDVKSCI